MTAWMVLAKRLDLMHRLPPVLLTKRALRRSGAADGTPEPAQLGLAGLAHLAFGALLGAAFLLGERELDVPGPSALHAAAFASAVWALSYAGWIPALDLMPPPQRDEPGRPVAMLVAHWVYAAGLVAALAADDRIDPQD